MASSPTPAGTPSVTPLVRWLVLILASIGFAFDIYELLMLPLVGPDALPVLGVKRGTPEFRIWVAMLFYIPALFGGALGLYGGYLTDRFGRRAVLTYSILLYALSAFFAAYSTSPLMLLVFRCGVFVGVCVEFVAAVAWLAELFPEPAQREKALGYTQAFSSVGGLMVAVAYGICQQYRDSFPPIALPGFLSFLGTIEGPQDAWRYTLMSGLIPAIPLLLIRPFLPESPAWKQKHAAGTLKRPSVRELFATPSLRTVTIVTTIMFACSYGAAFGAIQQMRNIIPGLEVAQTKAQKIIEQNHPNFDKYPEAKQKAIRAGVTRGAAGKINGDYTKVQEIGGLVGRFALALLVLQIVSRRALIRVFQIPGLIITPLVFYFFLQIPNQTLFEVPLEWMFLHSVPITPLNLCVAAVAFCTVAQFSFWGNYLPRVYPLHLRGTGESFAANVGGRMIGTSFAAVTVGMSFVMGWVGIEGNAAQWATAAALVGGFVYLVGFIASFFLPEPAAEELPEDEAVDQKIQEDPGDSPAPFSGASEGDERYTS